MNNVVKINMRWCSKIAPNGNVSCMKWKNHQQLACMLSQRRKQIRVNSDGMKYVYNISCNGYHVINIYLQNFKLPLISTFKNPKRVSVRGHACCWYEYCWCAPIIWTSLCNNLVVFAFFAAAFAHGQRMHLNWSPI